MCILTCRGLLRVSVPACTCRQDARALSSRAWLLQCRLLRSLALVWEEDTSGTGEEAHASATVARATDTGVAGEAQAKIWFAQDGWYIYCLCMGRVLGRMTGLRWYNRDCEHLSVLALN